MSSRSELTVPRSRLIPGFGLLIAAAIAFLYPAVGNVLGFYSVSSWSTTSGTITELSAADRPSDPSRNVHSSTRYSFAYEFTVDGVPYRSSRYSFCHISQKRVAYKILRSKSIRTTQAVPVHYDSANPRRSVLQPCAPGVRVYGKMLVGLVPLGCAIGMWIHSGFFAFLAWLRGWS
ncbi:MAG: DUF3592 domain-containing protein [Elainellaceae cyanobacterium]